MNITIKISYVFLIFILIFVNYSLSQDTTEFKNKNHTIDTLKNHNIKYQDINYFRMGLIDGKKYYKGTVHLFTGAASAILFLPAAVIIATFPPDPYKLKLPNKDLLNNVNYYNGVEKGAHRKQIRKIAIGTSVGFLTLGALVIGII